MGRCQNCHELTTHNCTRCNKPLCNNQLCSIFVRQGRVCKDCLIILNDKSLITEYFSEKYAQKALLTLLVLLIIPLAYSQIINVADYEKNCWNVNDDYYENQAVYDSNIINWPNGTKENQTTFLRYDDVLIRRTIQKCNETVGISGKSIDFKLQGYNCKNTTGEVICDSCTDGNCDGICSPNGGETCARIINNDVQYKNSAVSWDEKSGIIASRMEV